MTLNLENITLFMGYALIAFIPVLLWLYFFKNHLPRKKSYIVLTFIAGMCSVLPMKLYEKYWDTAILNLEHINLFTYLSELSKFQELGRLLAYITAMILVVLGLFVFTAFLMFLLEVFSGDDTVAVFRKKMLKIFESPFLFISVGIICGMIAFFSSFSWHEKIWFFIMVGILEEFIKHLVLRFSDEFKIHSVAEAVQFSIIVALGFSFVENILYFDAMENFSGLSTKALITMIVLRSIISVGAHIGFSSVLGYFYGIAKFAKEIYQEEEAYRRHFIIEGLHQLLHLKNSVLFHEQKMMEGVIFAMVLHGAFNSFLEFGYIKIIFPYIIFLLWLVIHFLHRQTRYEREGLLLYCPHNDA